jgi:hypothetical protein
VRDGVVVVEVRHPAKHVCELGPEIGVARRSWLARSGRVGVREVLRADDLVREADVERADEVVAATCKRLDARDAMAAVRLLLLHRDGLALHVARGGVERRQERRVHRGAREVAGGIGVADGMIRGAGHVLTERLRADAIADQRVHLASERAALRRRSLCVKLARAAWTGARERAQRQRAGDPPRSTTAIPHRSPSRRERVE